MGIVTCDVEHIWVGEDVRIAVHSSNEYDHHRPWRETLPTDLRLSRHQALDHLHRTVITENLLSGLRNPCRIALSHLQLVWVPQ